MGLTASTLYLSTVDQDGTWGTDIRKLDIVDIALNTTTTVNFGTGTAATTRTVDPYTAASAIAGDSRTLYGWAVNVAGATDGMDAATGRRRLIPAGVWSFTASLAVPAASGVGGTISVVPQAAVYRVSADGATRTQLFTASAASQQTTTLGGAQTLSYSWSSTSQSAILLEVGETIEVGYTLTSTQVVGTLGSAVNVTITFRTGGGVSTVVVPTGVRTQYDRSTSETTTTSDTLTKQMTYARSLSETLTTSDSLTRQFTGARSFSETVTGSDSFARQIIYGRSFNEYPTGVQPDYAVTFPLKKLSDVVYNHETGLPLTGIVATVELFRDSDNKHVQTTSSSATDGTFTFLRDLYDPNTYWYKARYVTAGGVQVHGVSDRGITPVPV